MSCVSTNFQVYPNADALIQIQMSPVVPIGGWNVEFIVKNRFYGISGLIVQSMASGYGSYQSGMAVINSGTGIMGIRISGGSISGFQGAYAYSINRLGSGVASTIAEGYLLATV